MKMKTTEPGYLAKQKSKGKIYLFIKKTYREGNKGQAHLTSPSTDLLLQ